MIYAETAQKCFTDFKAALDAIIVTDASGMSLDFISGIAKTCEVVVSGHRQLQTEPQERRRKVMFIGNGGSAAIASHMAIDFWKNGRIKATAFNDPSLLTCIANDYGYEFVFEKPIEMFADNGDVLIAISSSGNSKNILNGADMAVKKSCPVITLSGFKPDNPLRKKGGINFYVPSNVYGIVEVIHQYICHLILDTIMDGGACG
ncbi:MAG: SIS domain-containing protein [Nitrospirae bacterium]|nr:SIS domain-containing protein [Nitrospirota bacterium]MBF0618094.1 SIS domain-containing protein [Nitrospirota bacterium]